MFLLEKDKISSSIPDFISMAVIIMLPKSVNHLWLIYYNALHYITDAKACDKFQIIRLQVFCFTMRHILFLFVSFTCFVF